MPFLELQGTTLAYARHGDLVGLARLLGHSDLNTTALYTQPTAEDLGARLDRLPLNAYA